MLTAMCPNCRHRFPVPGCCNPDSPSAERPIRDCNASYCSGGLLVPRSYYNSNAAGGSGGYFINAPTIIHGPMVIQSNCDNGDKLWGDVVQKTSQIQTNPSTDVDINSTCDLTGGSTMTITAPSAQSGGDCFIQTNDPPIIFQAPTIEVRKKLSAGGGYSVQKKLSSDDCASNDGIIVGMDNYSHIHETLSNLSCSDSEHNSPSIKINKMEAMFVNSPPSACQELPGTRRTPSPSIFTQQHTIKCNSSNCTYCSSMENPTLPIQRANRISEKSGVQIQVNATLQLPSNVGHCTVNITATTNSTSTESASNFISTPTSVRVVRNNFNGGGLINVDNINCEENDRREEAAPTTPLSWLTPCPWAFDNYLAEKDLARLQEIKRLLHMSGWYHEGLSWQQSENILKNSPVGKWLLRDSSDSRYAFAVSVQTTRGPTSVRILYSYGKFRLDAEPTLAHAMPTFDCPIKMLEYYVEYSKKIQENQRHVWVDYSGLLFSHIYLTQPLVKEARSLLHLARLALDKTKLNFDNLPAPIKNYINEYPYSF